MQKLSHQEILQERVKNRNLERLPISLLLDNIRSLYNVGSLFRLADGARLERVLLTGITGTPPHSGIAKTALGAEKSVPWEYHVDARKCAERLVHLGYQLIVLEHVKSSRVHWEADYHFPLCLVIGNEIKGVQPDLVHLADETIEIPMKGEKNSLNAAMAAGIVVYEMMRQLAVPRELCSRG